jgi:DNA polymerase
VVVTAGESPNSAAQKRQIAELARALRHQLQWQVNLGAEGSPLADPAELEELTRRIRTAKMKEMAGPPRAKTAKRAPPSAPPESKSAPSRRAPPPNRTSMPLTAVGLPKETVRVQQAVPGVDPSAASAGLDAVRRELGDCQRCKLGAARRNLVFGVGDPQADLVFVGEAPGLHEDRQGEPFVGDAGILLTKMIGAMGLRREDVYILNVIKCRPPGNRDPEPDELAACEPFLIKQLEALHPKVIVTLGRYASQALLRESTGIKRLRGQWRNYQGIKLMPTFHPSYVLRAPDNKRLVWEDLQAVMKELAGEVAPS